MKGKMQEILSGWANVIKDYVDKLPEEIKKLSEKRLLICDECSLRTSNVCSTKKSGEVVKDFVYAGKLRKQGEVHKGCGCNLAAKTKSLESMCPLGKW